MLGCAYYVSLCSEREGKTRQSNGIPPLILWVSIGCVTGITLLAVLIVTGILCKRRMADTERRKRSYVDLVLYLACAYVCALFALDEFVV